MKMTKRRWGVAAAAILIVLLAVWALLPDAIEADVATVVRGPLEVSVAEDGMTRIRERYEVAAPVAGRLLRVEVHAGDAVEANAPLVHIEPVPLDPKQEAQLTARLRSAERAASEAQALVLRARAAAQRAHTEAGRIRALAGDAIVSRDALDAAQAADSMAARDHEAARFRAEATAYDVAVARAALGQVSGTDVTVRSPVKGRVLGVKHESETVVAAGTPLILVGDPASLEIVADFLSSDAVRIRRGAAARIERWGGPKALDARVRIVEPAGFTKISALGVEEQRVNVIADLLEPAPTLGDQYRVDVRVVLWRGEALKVPASALFSTAGQWKVFALREGRARLQSVTIGQMGETEVEITGGLREGETVIVHPSDQVRDGVKITRRKKEGDGK